MGQKSKHHLNSFINESYHHYYKSTKPSISSTNTLTTKNSNVNAAASKSTQQIDKQTLIKKQLINNEIANFNGMANLGEDGLKIISDFVNANLNNTNTNNNNINPTNTNNNNNSNNNNNNNNNAINYVSPTTLPNSMTLGNLNTPIANHTSQTPCNLGKKNIKFSEDTNFYTSTNTTNSVISKKSGSGAVNTSTLHIQNKNFTSAQNETESYYKLKEIKLTKCNIGDEGFAILSSCFDKTGSVQVLNLKGNKIKDKSLKNVLNIIKSNKTLKHFVLLQNLFSQAKKENIKINAKLLNPNLKLEI